MVKLPSISQSQPDISLIVICPLSFVSQEPEDRKQGFHLNYGLFLFFVTRYSGQVTFYQ